MARRLQYNVRSVRVVFRSESLHWRNLPLGYHNAEILFTDDGTAEIRNFPVDLIEGALREFVRWRKVFLKLHNELLCALDLIRRQRDKNSVHRFDFRYAMTKNHNVVSRF